MENETVPCVAFYAPGDAVPLNVPFGFVRLNLVVNVPEDEKFIHVVSAGGGSEITTIEGGIVKLYNWKFMRTLADIPVGAVGIKNQVVAAAMAYDWQASLLPGPRVTMTDEQIDALGAEMVDSDEGDVNPFNFIQKRLAFRHSLDVYVLMRRRGFVRCGLCGVWRRQEPIAGSRVEDTCDECLSGTDELDFDDDDDFDEDEEDDDFDEEDDDELDDDDFDDDDDGDFDDEDEEEDGWLEPMTP